MDETQHPGDEDTQYFEMPPGGDDRTEAVTPYVYSEETVEYAQRRGSRADEKKNNKKKRKIIIASITAAVVAAIAATALALVLSKSGAIGKAAASAKIADVLNPKWQPKPPESFYAPLSGIVMSEDAYLRRPIAVKVENEPPARPQSGLDRADVIYEVPMEGYDVTRYIAIFQSRAASNIGPVRSARFADVNVVPQYKAVFGHCGGVWQVLQMVKKAGIVDLDEFFNSEAYWRADFRSAPHNLYTSTSLMWQLAKKKGAYRPTRLPSFGFKDQERRAKKPVRTIEIPYGDQTNVVWTYHRKSNSYRRSQQGEPHTDNVTGRQLAARNLVLLYAVQTVTDIEEDVFGSKSLKFGLAGEGKATIFRDGQRINGRWTASKTSPPVFTSGAGSRVLFNRGNMWIEIVPTTMKVSIK